MTAWDFHWTELPALAGLDARTSGGARRLAQFGNGQFGAWHVSDRPAPAPRARHRQPMSDGSIRLVIADDHPVFRRGMRALLGTVPDLAVVGEAESGADAVRLCAELAPDVVLMDLQMPGGSGIEAP